MKTEQKKYYQDLGEKALFYKQRVEATKGRLFFSYDKENSIEYWNYKKDWNLVINEAKESMIAEDSTDLNEAKLAFIKGYKCKANDLPRKIELV